MNLKTILIYIRKRIFVLIETYFRSRYSMDMYIAKTNVVALTHKETFAKYRNINQGKDIVIVATGPSLNQYQPIQNTINIGVNKAIFYDKVNLNYYFAIDYNGVKDYISQLSNFKNVKKFYGVLPEKHYGYSGFDASSCIIPESIILSQNAGKFYIYSKQPIHPTPFNVDIDKTWLADGGSCIFSAMQFALFTNPKRIYLVGCDCSNSYYDGRKCPRSLDYLIKTWKELKKFANIYYPDTEIISVNPVGLKGIFKDLYQDEEDKLG